MLENLLQQIHLGQEVRSNLIALKKELEGEQNREIVRRFEIVTKDEWILLLSHEDAKVRKNAALILGILEEPGFSEPLFSAYFKENTLFVKSAYLKALTHYDCGAFEEAFQKRREELESGEHKPEELKHIAEELQQIKKLLPERSHQRHVFRMPSSPVRMVFTCAKEYRPLLLEQVSKIAGEQESKAFFCGVMTRSARFKELFALRTYQSVLFAVNGCKASEKKDLINDVLSGNLYALLELLHEPEEKNLFYFRISGNGFDSGKLGRELEAASMGKLVNSVSDYEMELLFFEKKDQTVVTFLKLHTRPDQRFSYRKNVVATSMHPVKAASMIALVKDYLKKGAQVYDPFCGVGTLLIERDREVKASYLYGTDIFGEAIEAGRKNAELAGTAVNFIHRDFSDFTHAYLFDEMITEMPKMRHEEAEPVYRKLFERAGDLLKPHGIMILYSAEMGFIKKQLRLMKEKLSLLREYPVSEKEGASVYIIEKQF